MRSVLQRMDAVGNNTHRPKYAASHAPDSRLGLPPPQEHDNPLLGASITIMVNRSEEAAFLGGCVSAYKLGFWTAAISDRRRRAEPEQLYVLTRCSLGQKITVWLRRRRLAVLKLPEEGIPADWTAGREMSRPAAAWGVSLPTWCGKDSSWPHGFTLSSRLVA